MRAFPLFKQPLVPPRLRCLITFLCLRGLPGGRAKRATAPALFLALAALLFPLAALSEQARLQMPVVVGVCPDFEGFVIWKAKRAGLDAAAGLDFNLNFYDRVKDALAHQDGFALGYAPAAQVLAAHMTRPLEIIGAGRRHYECAIMADKRSALMRARGWSPEMPNVYGSPATVRDLPFFLSRNDDAAAFLSRAWLHSLGMSLKDVHLAELKSAAELEEAWAQDRVRAAALCDLRLASLAPSRMRALREAANFRSLRLEMPVVFFTREGFAAANPETTSGFLAVFLKSLGLIENEAAGQKRAAQDAGASGSADLELECVEFLKAFSSPDVGAAALLRSLSVDECPKSAEAQLRFLTSDEPSSLKGALTRISRQLLLSGAETYRRTRPHLTFDFVKPGYLEALRAPEKSKER